MSDRRTGTGRGFPDPYTVATTKLSQDWSVSRCVPHINSEWIDSLLQDERFFSIDPMMKVRLLLAGTVAAGQPMFQSRDDARLQLQRSLIKLQQAAATDADEWVKVMAAAGGNFDGRLDLEAVMQQSAVVQETITTLKQHVQESVNQHLFPPLEGMYISTKPSVITPNSRHFQLREHPRVQPLATSIGSYTGATPPPPPVQITRPGEQHGAAFLRPQARLNKQSSLARTASGAEEGAAVPHSKHSRSLRPTKVHLLDDTEQAEMQDVLQRSLKSKGHGIAASVRHEEAHGHRSHRTAASQQQHLEAAGDAVLEALELDNAEHAPGLGDRRWQEHHRGASATDAAPQVERAGGYDCRAAAAAATREAALDEEIDELFEDSPGDNTGPDWGPTAAGFSRSAKGLRHHAGEMEDEDVPAELQDVLDDEMQGVEQEEIGDGGQLEGVGQWEGQGDAASGVLAAKRKRVILDDDDDD